MISEKGLFFLADKGETVAQGKNHLLCTGVAGYMVVELEDALGLRVMAVGWINDVTVPQGVVCHDEATRPQQGQEGLKRSWGQVFE